MKRFMLVVAVVAMLLGLAAVPAGASASAPGPIPANTVIVKTHDGPLNVSTCGPNWICLWVDQYFAGNEIDFYYTALTAGGNINLYPGPFDNAITSVDNQTAYHVAFWVEPNCPGSNNYFAQVKTLQQIRTLAGSGFNDRMSCLKRIP